jgi:hypothetical protein
MKKLLVSRRYLVCALLLVCLPITCLANNVSISGVTLANASAGQADIQFTLSWDNSWNETWTESGGSVTVTNWDAIWVFAKYRQNGGLWKHVRLTATGHTATGATVIDVADDGGGKRLGAFVRRNATGSGTVTCTNMRLHWDLAAAGLPSADDIDITVMGVEMVYISQGAFYLGSGGEELNHFYAAPDTAAAYLVTSEAEITIGDSAGDLQATGGVNGGPVPADYPKGFGAFYCMKYEMTEGQYVDFLNLLDASIAATFFPNSGGALRHTIVASAGGYESSAPDRACSYMNADRLLTYLDWCGLRPISEMEFEKVCRGARAPWINEYAWGDSTMVILTGFQGTDGSGIETALPAGANVHYSNSPFYGPVRAGIFATGSATRASAGAGYYGVMEMTGNLNEMVVGIYDVGGRSYTGAHGDGNEYSAYTDQWQASSSFAYSGKGGHFLASPGDGRTSDRRYIASRIYLIGSPALGGRGVRTAP